MRRRLFAALLIVVGALSANAAPAAADETVNHRATTTYEFVPSKGIIKVTIDLRVVNHIPSTTEYVACTKYEYDLYYGLIPYTSTCPQTTNYYVNDTAAWIEDGASNLAVKADSGSVTRSVRKHQDGYTQLKLSFAKIFKGHTRKLHITYTIRSGRPRSSTFTRAGAAYARFCATGNGVDGGSVNVVVPKSFSITLTGDASRSTSGSKVTYKSGTIADPLNYYLCLEGTNAAAYRRTTVEAPGGRAMTIESWPEDAAWLSSVRDEATTSIAALEVLIGRDIPESGTLTIREVAASQLGDYVGTFDPATLVANVSEAVEPGTVAHELSHAWFNGRLFEDQWLREGYAGWAENAATGASPCNNPGTYPGTGSPDLANWQFLGPKATGQQKAVVGYDYDASCAIVTSVARSIGDIGLQGVFAYLLDHQVPYLNESTDRLPDHAVTWQTWLDVVDEVGMVPAGADLDTTQELLAQYGIATDAEKLAQRSRARHAYHSFEALEPSWQVPAFLRGELAKWDFSGALEALGVASQLRAVARDTDAALPEAGAITGRAEVAFEEADSTGDLRAAISDATDLKDAATNVAAAIATSNEERGPLDQIGLIGTDLGPMRVAAVAAVQASDPFTAEARAADLTATLDGAQTSGAIRVGGVTMATLLAGAGGILIVRRRRRSAAMARAEALDLSVAEASGAPFGPSETVVLPVSGEAATVDQVLDAPSSAGSGNATETDPTPPSTNDEAESPGEETEGAEASLRTLEHLHAEGLVSDEEYAVRRRAIIEGI